MIQQGSFEIIKSIESMCHFTKVLSWLKEELVCGMGEQILFDQRRHEKKTPLNNTKKETRINAYGSKSCRS